MRAVKIDEETETDFLDREKARPVSDKLLTTVLMVGIRNLSMGFASIPAAKQVIQGVELKQAELLAKKVQSMKTKAEIRAYLKEFAKLN